MIKIYWIDEDEEILNVRIHNDNHKISMENYDSDLEYLENKLPPLTMEALKKALEDFWSNEMHDEEWI